MSPDRAQNSAETFAAGIAVAVVVAVPQEVLCALTVQQWHRLAKSISQPLHPPLPIVDLAMERAVAALEDKHRRDATNLLGQAHLVAATAQNQHGLRLEFHKNESGLQVHQKKVMWSLY